MLAHGQYTRTDGAPAGGVYGRFYLEAVPDELATAREGRPIFREEERVEIIIPGNQYTQPVHRVNDEHRARWPAEYAAFKNGQEQARNGTPLEEWCALGRAQVAELKAMNIHTVEDVAGLADTTVQRVMGLYGLRTKAQGWLDDAQQTAIVGQLQSENDALRSELASEKRQREELSEMVRNLHADVTVMRNAPHPLMTQVPAMMDPMQAGGYANQAQQASAGSSLAAFGNDAPRRGRPRKVDGETLVA